LKTGLKIRCGHIDEVPGAGFRRPVGGRYWELRRMGRSTMACRRWPRFRGDPSAWGSVLVGQRTMAWDETCIWWILGAV